MKSHHSGHILLTTADRQSEVFTHGVDAVSSFDESLYDAILFRDGAVLPDIYAFISGAMANSQTAHTTTHLDSAIEAGFIVPAFRGSCTTFVDSLKLAREQGIQGLQPRPELIARRLDECFEGLKTDNKTQWPDSISNMFGESVIRGLTSILAIHESAEVSAAPERNQTSAMAAFIRKHQLLQRIEELSSSSATGLRRGAAYNAICDSLNQVTESGKSEVHDSSADLVCHPACQASSDIKLAVHGLVALLNATYQLNMAKSFRTGGYTPGRIFAPETKAALAIATRSVHKVHDGESFNSATDVLRLTVQVNLPSIRQLKAVPWADLLAIRKDVGRGYRAALVDWQNNPDEFEKCVKDYAAALSSRLRSKASLATIALQGLGDSDKDAIKSGAKFAVGVISENKTAAAFLAAAEPLGNVFFSWGSENGSSIEFMHSRHSAIVV